MAYNKIPLLVIQSYLATQPPETEIDLVTLAAKLREQSLQQAVSFFSTLSEIRKVQYMFYLYNYYYNLLSQEFVPDAWLLELSADDTTLQEIEDDFIIKYNIDTTQIVILRKLISRLQKEVAKQRKHNKKEDNSNITAE